MTSKTPDEIIDKNIDFKPLDKDEISQIEEDYDNRCLGDLLLTARTIKKLAIKEGRKQERENILEIVRDIKNRKTISSSAKLTMITRIIKELQSQEEKT